MKFMNTTHRLLLLSFVLLLGIGCDQGTKYLAQEKLSTAPPISFLGDVFRFQYAENNGAFLSVGSGLPESYRFYLLTLLPVVFLTGLFFFVVFSRRLRVFEVVSYALIIAGGFSNLFDRILRHGFVVDFMNMGIGRLRTGIFNFADVSIMLGIFMLALNISQKYRKPTEPESSEEAAPGHSEEEPE